MRKKKEDCNNELNPVIDCTLASSVLTQYVNYSLRVQINTLFQVLVVLTLAKYLTKVRMFDRQLFNPTKIASV